MQAGNDVDLIILLLVDKGVKERIANSERE